MNALIELLKAILYGIVEGITEWLPVSSTGHLILLGDRLSFAFTEDPVLADEFFEMFQVVIQLGAILAVVVLFWNKLWPFVRRESAVERGNVWRLWGKVLIASIPAAVVGLLIDKLLEMATGRDIDGWLYNSLVVAAALIVYGIAFIVIERLRKDKPCRIERLEDITPMTALAVGAFQALSILPGTSRSGSTILGGMLLGLSRSVGAEFSFFMAIPAMAGASLIKALGFVKYLVEAEATLPWLGWGVLGMGCLVSFGVSMVAIRFLTDFVKRHTFTSFGIYRIALGIVVLVSLIWQ